MSNSNQNLRPTGRPKTRLTGGVCYDEQVAGERDALSSFKRSSLATTFPSLPPAPVGLTSGVAASTGNGLVGLTTGFRPREFAQLYAIERECFPKTKRFSERRFRRYLRTAEIIVARVAGEPVGFIMLTHGRHSSYVVSLAVLPAHRSTGIARRLLKAAEHHSDRLRLHVHADNPAQCLYFSEGYRALRVEPDFYARGQSAILMRKVVRA